jgi:hypothetical protein
MPHIPTIIHWQNPNDKAGFCDEQFLQQLCVSVRPCRFGFKFTVSNDGHAKAMNKGRLNWVDHIYVEGLNSWGAAR